MGIRLCLQIIFGNRWVILLTTLTTILAVAYFITLQYRTVASFKVILSTALVSRSGVLNSLNTLSGQSVISIYAVAMNSSYICANATIYLRMHLTEVKDCAYKTSVRKNSSILE
jgi:hypothetical protein